jgi:hypothetical protein|nr:MAG TPA: hypothetical protein [Caudoviricetes sp.]
MVTIPEIEQRLADYVIRDPRQFMPSDYDLRGVAEAIADTSLEEGDRHDPDWLKAVKPLLQSHFAKINVFDLDWEPVQHGDDIMLVAVFHSLWGDQDIVVDRWGDIHTRIGADFKPSRLMWSEEYHSHGDHFDEILVTSWRIMVDRLRDRLDEYIKNNIGGGA